MPTTLFKRLFERFGCYYKCIDKSYFSDWSYNYTLHGDTEKIKKLNKMGFLIKSEQKNVTRYRSFACRLLIKISSATFVLKCFYHIFFKF